MPRPCPHPRPSQPKLLPTSLNRSCGHVSFPFENFVYTYRIFKEKYGCYTIQTAEGTKKLRFLNLKDLISRFEKPNQGLVVPLLKPIQRSTPCLRWRRSKVERDSIYENSNSDYVEVLP
ncbi:SH2 domain-containing protein 1B isoform 2-T2 [Hipposideros larvatus]